MSTGTSCWRLHRSGWEAIRLLIGFRFGPVGIFFLRPDTVWVAGLILLSTVLSVALPIKIWNSARIEHRLQEQDKLLMAERVETLTRQLNPHFLFNTLTSISSLIRSQPETARMLIIRLSAMLRRLLRTGEHYVTLREELASVDEYLDIEAVRFGPTLAIEKAIGRRRSTWWCPRWSCSRWSRTQSSTGSSGR